MSSRTLADMRRSGSIAATLLLACTASPSPRPTTVTRAPTSSATCSAASSAPVVSAPPAPIDDPPPCEPTFPTGTADVAIAWNTCKDIGQWFATRGFPAISKDGQRIALAEHQDLLNVATTNLRVTFVDIDSGKEVGTVKILGPGEFDEAYVPATPETHATITPRIAQANLEVRDLVPMNQDWCAGPLPWPTDVFDGYDACITDPMPAQTVTCVSPKDAPAVHVLATTLKAPRFHVEIDGAKPFAIERDVTSWIEAYDSNWTPGGKGKKDRQMPPFLLATHVDFARRALVVHTAYCNTADSQPKFPDAWHVFRLPKLAKAK